MRCICLTYQISGHLGLLLDSKLDGAGGLHFSPPSSPFAAPLAKDIDPEVPVCAMVLLVRDQRGWEAKPHPPPCVYKCHIAPGSMLTFSRTQCPEPEERVKDCGHPDSKKSDSVTLVSTWETSVELFSFFFFFFSYVQNVSANKTDCFQAFF